MVKHLRAIAMHLFKKSASIYTAANSVCGEHVPDSYSSDQNAQPKFTFVSPTGEQISPTLFWVVKSGGGKIGQNWQGC